MKRLAVLVVPVLLWPVLVACGNPESSTTTTSTPSPRAGSLPDGAQQLRVPGTDALVFATRQVHPRGGFQVHVFLGVQGKNVELTDAGAPIVPFVATDVSGPGASADCAERAIVVTTAAPRSNGRLVVSSQRFGIEGAAVTAGEPRVLARSLTQAQLDKRFPAVGAREMFANC